jgi:hypothetical protein
VYHARQCCLLGLITVTFPYSIFTGWLIIDNRLYILDRAHATGKIVGNQGRLIAGILKTRLIKGKRNHRDR